MEKEDAASLSSTRGSKQNTNKPTYPSDSFGMWLMSLILISKIIKLQLRRRQTTRLHLLHIFSGPTLDLVRRKHPPLAIFQGPGPAPVKQPMQRNQKPNDRNPRLYKTSHKFTHVFSLFHPKLRKTIVFAWTKRILRKIEKSGSAGGWKHPTFSSFRKSSGCSEKAAKAGRVSSQSLGCPTGWTIW